MSGRATRCARTTRSAARTSSSPTTSAASTAGRARPEMKTEKYVLEEVGPGPEGGRTMVVNIGPQHPSTHGVLRLVTELDGETIVDVEPVIGYLHTGFEKTYETK